MFMKGKELDNKTGVKKPAYWGYPTMFMKTKIDTLQSHDIYENTGS